MGKVVAVAGTFNILHKGHEALLTKAFESGDVVHIGLTTDEMAQQGRIGVRGFEIRKKQLIEFIATIKVNARYEIVEISDVYGPAATGNYDTIVVSQGTRKGAESINEARKRAGLKPMDIVEVKTVPAEDGKPISSSRIQSGEIDKNGKLISRNP